LTLSFSPEDKGSMLFDVCPSTYNTTPCKNPENHNLNTPAKKSEHTITFYMGINKMSSNFKT
jgi:hypothetical protein